MTRPKRRRRGLPTAREARASDQIEAALSRWRATRPGRDGVEPGGLLIPALTVGRFRPGPSGDEAEAAAKVALAAALDPLPRDAQLRVLNRLIAKYDLDRDALDARVADLEAQLGSLA